MTQGRKSGGRRKIAPGRARNIAMMPLQGIRVLDLTVLDGYCGMELADYGAEVVKVECPDTGGDPVRLLPPLHNGSSLHHAFRDRGKKSLTLNVRHAAGRELFEKLVVTADVVLENFPPGVMESWGLGYDALAGLKPSLVYARLSAYGSTGPEIDVPQSDLIAQAKTGVMHVTGFPENPPTRVGFSIAERYAATFLASAVCIALYHARATGEGQMVETSLLGSVVAITEDKVLTYGATNEDPMRTGNAHPLINPYDILRCRDGYVAMGISSDDQWFKFCDAFARPEWKTDEKYGSNFVRGLHYFGDLRVKLEDLFAGQTMREIADVCDRALIPGTMCSTTAQAVSDPQLHARNMLITVRDKAIGELAMPGRPIKFAGESEEIPHPAPLLGEHNAEILGALALGATDLAVLRRQGII
jgi:crotonobetainyl-CoA:carnitine CoA-transferase CaiB-like acyl-CoA transferase